MNTENLNQSTQNTPGFFEIILKIIIQIILLPYTIIKLLGCRGIACIGCLGGLLIIAMCIGTIIIFIARPKGIWEKTIDLVNSTPPSQIDISKNRSGQNIENLLEQITSIGENNIKITEGEINLIISELSTNIKNLAVDIEPGIFVIYVAIDSGVENKPFWIEISLKLNENLLDINRLMFGKIQIPEFLHKPILSLLQTFLPIGGSELDVRAFLNEVIFKENPNLKVKDVELFKDFMELDVELDITL